MSGNFDDLNEENFLLYAIKAYDKPNCIMSEFEDDLKRFDYLKRLFFRYREYEELKERLIINQIIILSNVFGPDCIVRMLFFRLEDKNFSFLKTFLIYLNLMPERIDGVRGKNIYSSDIPVDMNIANVLRELS